VGLISPCTATHSGLLCFPFFGYPLNSPALRIFFYYSISNQNQKFYKLIWSRRLVGMRRRPATTPQDLIRSVGHFRFNRRLPSGISRGFRSGLVWRWSLLWWRILRCLTMSWTYGRPKSLWRVSLDTYHGVLDIILMILDWVRCIVVRLDLLAQPHSSRPYVQIGMMMVL
jgi:hypothetical protein